MSNEQKLREALRETLLFCETFSNRWDGETGAHPFGMVERARQALATTEPVMENGLTEAETDASASVMGFATTEPEPTGMPEPHAVITGKLGAHCSFNSNELRKGDAVYTEDQMRTYGEQCWKAGYKHGAWAQGVK